MNASKKKYVGTVLEFKWTVSRGQDTYGYNICSLWIHGQKVASCSGGGYDMKGTALAHWVLIAFEDKLKKLRGNSGSGDAGGGFYGLGFYNHKRNKRQKRWSKDCHVYLDGACGFESIVRILEHFKYKLQYVSGNANNSTYILN